MFTFPPRINYSDKRKLTDREKLRSRAPRSLLLCSGGPNTLNALRRRRPLFFFFTRGDSPLNSHRMSPPSHHINKPTLSRSAFSSCVRNQPGCFLHSAVYNGVAVCDGSVRTRALRMQAAEGWDRKRLIKYKGEEQLSR